MTANRLILVLSVAGCISGCTTVGSYQADCEKQHSAFPDVVRCLKDALAKDWRPSASKDARVRLYLLKADQLSQRVQRGELSDLDARVALQELYVNLKRDEDAEKRSSRPLTTECSEFLGKVQCTTR